MDGRLLIGGSWLLTDESFDVDDPATGERVGTAAEAGPREPAAAVDTVAKAFPACRPRLGS
jgi:succinate-semialdehyde dehydrogenase/glutarate-semialdehyde dehydrogenase